MHPENTSALSVAIAYWRRDEPAPAHIVARLIDQGFDVGHLEHYHRNRSTNSDR